VTTILTKGGAATFPSGSCCLDHMKSKRQAAILSIIREKSIETQKQLLDRLQLQGFVVTQATVSRDIKELGLIKVKVEEGRYCYAPPRPHTVSNVEARIRRAFSDYVVDIAPCGDFVFIKTLPGAAQTVAGLLDGLDWSEIMGTIGGDDTILVLVREEGVPANPLVRQVLAKLLKLR
jgi:transcriptional regulator of arginine metabolism